MQSRQSGVVRCRQPCLCLIGPDAGAEGKLGTETCVSSQQVLTTPGFTTMVFMNRTVWSVKLQR